MNKHYQHNLRPYPPYSLFPRISLSNSSKSRHRDGNSSNTDCFRFDPKNSPTTFPFACRSKDFQGKWQKLYTSDIDGLSFNRLQLALFGYSGPTIMIFHEGEDCKLGAYTTSKWKESTDFYGSNGHCFLFQLEPHFQIMEPLGGSRSKRHFQFCKIKGSMGVSGQGQGQGQGRGIGFGGTLKNPRLFLSESMDDCFANHQDSTFEKGELLPSKQNEFGDRVPRKNFYLDYVEVWGVGANDETVMNALDAQSQHRAIADASIQKARQVDKKQFLNDFQSGLIESKAFVHREQMRGRGAR